jgi:hypothetical protein
VTQVLSQHTLRFGADIRLRTSTNPGNSAGSFSFNLATDLNSNVTPWLLCAMQILIWSCSASMTTKSPPCVDLAIRERFVAEMLGEMERF